MPSLTHLTSASAMLRRRLLPALRTRSGATAGPSPGHEQRPEAYLFDRTLPRPAESRNGEDGEPLGVTITLFLVSFMGVCYVADTDLIIERWAHEKALERLEMEKLAVSSPAASDSD